MTHIYIPPLNTVTPNCLTCIGLHTHTHTSLCHYSQDRSGVVSSPSPILTSRSATVSGLPHDCALPPSPTISALKHILQVRERVYGLSWPLVFSICSTTKWGGPEGMSFCSSLSVCYLPRRCPSQPVWACFPNDVTPPTANDNRYCSIVCLDLSQTFDVQLIVLLLLTM